MTDQIQWAITGGLTIIGGQGTASMSYQAAAYGCEEVGVKVVTQDGEECTDKVTVSVPEAYFITEGGKRVDCLGIANHAPAIRLTAPIESGQREEKVAAQRDGSSDNYKFQIKGHVDDPIGTEGLPLVVGTDDCLGVTVTPVFVALGSDGSFSLQVTANGLGPKRVVLRCGQNVAILAGFLDAADITDSLDQSAQQLDQFRQDYDDQCVKAFQGPDNPDAAGTQNDFSDNAIDARAKTYQSGADGQSGVDGLLTQRDQLMKSALDQAVFTWSAGVAAGPPDISGALYRLRADDCTANTDPEFARVDTVDVTMESTGGGAVSSQPRTFLIGSAFRPWPRFAKNPECQIIALPGQNFDGPIDYSYFRCNWQQKLYQVEFDIRGGAFIAQDRDANGDPTGEPRTTAITLKAILHTKCTEQASFSWRAIYGPDLSALKLVQSGETCTCSSTVPGTYLVEACALTDHTNKTAVGIVEFEVLEVAFHLDASDIEYLKDDQGNISPAVDLTLDTTDVYPVLRYTSDGGLWRSWSPGAPTIHWRGTEADASRTGAKTVDEEKDEGIRTYQLPQTPAVSIAVSAEVKWFNIAPGGLFDASALALKSDLGTIQCIAGAPDKVSAKIVSPESDALIRPLTDLDPIDPADDIAPLIDFAIEDAKRAKAALTVGDGTDPADPAAAVAAKIKAKIKTFESFGVGDPTLMAIKIVALDKYGNPARQGTPVLFDLFGAGALTTSQESNGLNADGIAWAKYSVTRDALDHSLIKITVGDKFYFVGHLLAAAQFSLVPADAAGLNGSTLVIKNLRGESSATVTCSISGKSLPAGTTVALRIANGSITIDPNPDASHKKWGSEAAAVTDALGAFKVWFSPKYFNPDGTSSLVKFDAWGDTNLNISVGEGSQLKTVHFDTIESIRRRPRIRFPMMNFVTLDSDTPTFVRPPADSNPIGTRPGNLEVNAPAGQTALLELSPNPSLAKVQPSVKLDMTYETWALFRFAGAGGAVAPAVSNSATPTSEIRGNISLKLRGAQAAILSGSTLLSWLDFAELDPNVSQPSATALPGAVRMGASTLAQLGIRSDYRYAANVPGSPGFRVTFWVRPQDQTDWEIVRVEGSNDDKSVDSSSGAVSIKYTTSGGLSSISASYIAIGCPTRPQIQISGAEVACAANTWSFIDVRLEPSLGDSSTKLSLIVNPDTSGGIPLTDSVVVDKAGFNFLPGDEYYLGLGIPDTGHAHVALLTYEASPVAKPD